MSSDSDDLDEDELLQIALREQAERDLNYQRPSSKPRKPVANYVQPPPAPHQQKNSASAAAPAKASYNGVQRQAVGGNKSKSSGNGNRRVVDDDDDSEVEMLSISSGDEDSTKDRVASRGRGGVNGGSRPGRDEDRAWDGEEPDCWKRVDEDEVSSRW